VVQGWGGKFPGGNTLFNTRCGWSTSATPSQYSPAHPDRTTAGLAGLLLSLLPFVEGMGRSREGTFLPNAAAPEDGGGGGEDEEEVAAGEGSAVSVEDEGDGKLTP